MKEITISADDFGYFSAVNLGITKSYKEETLTSTTSMTNMPGRDETIMFVKENPDLGVGGHLVLTCGKPLTRGTSLIDGNEDFYNLAEYKKHRNEMCGEEISQEWSHQINYLMDHELQLTHLDSHRHVRSLPENLEVMERIAEEYHSCSRNVSGSEEDIGLPSQKKIKGFPDLMNHSAICDLTIPLKKNRTRYLEKIQTVFDQITDSGIAELMVHPAYVDEILYFNSPFNIQRMEEVSVLCDLQMK